MKASLILPLYNSERYVEECLDSIENQSFKDFELLILDDCSKDRTVSILKNRKIKFYSNSVNLGFCKNVNKGIRMANGDYIAILDHDVVYDKDYLKKMLDENAEITGGRYYYYKQKEKIRALNVKISLITGKTNIIGRDEIDRGQYDSLREIDAIGAGALMVKKEVFEKIGLLNEALIMYFVDAEFCARAKKSGYKIILSKAKCWHKKEEKEEMTVDQKKRYFHDKLIFMRRYPLPFLITCLQIFLNRIRGK